MTAPEPSVLLDLAERDPLTPEAAEAIRIADLYLPGAPAEYRRQCAHDILLAIMNHAGIIAMQAIRIVGAHSTDTVQGE